MTRWPWVRKQEGTSASVGEAVQDTSSNEQSEFPRGLVLCSVAPKTLRDIKNKKLSCLLSNTVQETAECCHHFGICESVIWVLVPVNSWLWGSWSCPFCYASICQRCKYEYGTDIFTIQYWQDVFNNLINPLQPSQLKLNAPLAKIRQLFITQQKFVVVIKVSKRMNSWKR